MKTITVQTKFGEVSGHSYPALNKVVFHLDSCRRFQLRCTSYRRVEERLKAERNIIRQELEKLASNNGYKLASTNGDFILNFIKA
jgi:hypothetical protein